MRIRRTTTALALAAAVIVPAAVYASPSFASSSSHKPATAVFTANGTITAVDPAAETLTVKVKGGTRDVRGKTVTITVGTATRLRLNGKRSTLSALAAGDRVAVTGVHQSADYRAARIEATVEHKKAAPSDDPTPEPSSDDTPGSPTSIH